MKVACIQLSSGEDYNKNLKDIVKYIEFWLYIHLYLLHLLFELWYFLTRRSNIPSKTWERVGNRDGGIDVHVEGIDQKQKNHIKAITLKNFM